MTGAPRDDLIGRSLAQYTVEGRLGQGGMGAVYLARDGRLGRQVALKVIAAPGGENGELAARLVREARTASSLSHPNIVTIHEIGHDAGVDFIVMERVDGTPLSSLIPPGGMPLPQAIGLGCQIAAAVAAAHAAHVIHRDLKPANVMVTPGGQAKVLDFGLARVAATAVLDDSAATWAASTRLTGTRTILGSVGYMSPEQIEGRTVDEASDVFSLGVLLYEMVSGRRPFAGDSEWAVLAATMQAEPPPLESLRPAARGELARIVARCLAKRPQDRYPSAAGVAADLQRLASSRAEGSDRKRPPRGMLPAAAALVVVAAGIVVWLLVRDSRLRWARETAVADVARRSESGDLVGAFLVARKALGIAPHDFEVKRAWSHLTTPGSQIQSEPAGAEVAIRSYLRGGDDWVTLGTTPITAPIPIGLLRWRLTRVGYDTLEVGQGPEMLEFKLVPAGTAPPGMVLVPRGPVQIPSSQQEIDLPEFWLDRHEVTNRQYKAFVDAGGYRNREHWREPFVEHGRSIPWDRAMERFRDATGRPGPSTWELGTYPAGQDDHPVGGVSWYEAAAYAAYARRQLPTVYHWYRASGAFGVFSEIIGASNFSAKGPIPVGSTGGLGPFGTLDMAGNVKEWCWNATGDRRYTLGGGWNELVYAFHDEDAQSPFERQPSFGFRCMMSQAPLAPDLTAPLEQFERDPASLQAARDEVFGGYARLYDYDPSPLEARTEWVNDGHPEWREELVTVRPAYGTDRLPIRIYLPKKGPRPLQAVVMFPGSNATRTNSSRSLSLRMSDFHIRAGRVLVYPIYQGTYERRIPGQKGMNQMRDIMIQRGKDIRRTMDYLVTRPDIDSTRIAFYGISLGAQDGPTYLAIEPRFRAGVLFSGGFETYPIPPECNPVHFAPRVRQPVLMVNGREDFDLPYETSQVPMFRMLGAADKRHVVLEGGHIPLDPREAIRVMLDWLDQRLGPPS